VAASRRRPLAQRGEHARDHGCVDRLQARDGRHREPLQPATHRARRRHDLDFAEAVKQRIVLDEGEVPQPPTRSVFERYNIVSSGDLRTAAVQLQGLTGTKQGQSGTLSTSSESEASRIAK